MTKDKWLRGDEEVGISIMLIVVGFVLLIEGANVLVDGASSIAKKFKIPEIVIGLTIVSIGTSLPELMVSLSSALKGYQDITIGNVIETIFLLYINIINIPK